MTKFLKSSSANLSGFATVQEALKSKVIEPQALASTVAKIRQEGLSIATINGSFDLLHAGHLHILYEAAKKGDVLIVALNSDLSIRQYKGKERPIIDLKSRLSLMAALAFVTFVTWFDETDPIALLEKVRPDVHVNGSDWGLDCIEAPTVKKYGGQIHIVERIAGLSTTEIIEKIKNLCD